MNEGFTYSERIDRRGEGRAVAVYLGLRYDHSPEAVWRERIAQGLVLLDGAPTRDAVVLKRGQTLTWTRPPWQEPQVPLTYETLFEDAAILAVAKPAGLPTMPAGGFLANTLLSLVRRTYADAAAVHRLGRGTSGIVLFAKTPAAARSLAQAWREQRVTKIYRGLVEGSPSEDSFAVEAAIGPVRHPALGTVYAAAPGGKASRSEAKVLERRRDCSLVEVRIATGRPHQIRIHMAVQGHPLVGDPLYSPGGGFKPDSAALPGDTGYLLHAARLSFPHPSDQNNVDIVCAPDRILTTNEEVSRRQGQALR